MSYKERQKTKIPCRTAASLAHLEYLILSPMTERQVLEPKEKLKKIEKKDITVVAVDLPQRPKNKKIFH